MLHRITELQKVARNENVARNGHVKSYATSSAFYAHVVRKYMLDMLMLTNVE